MCPAIFNKCLSRFHSVFPSETGDQGKWSSPYEEFCNQGISWRIHGWRWRKEQEDLKEKCCNSSPRRTEKIATPSYSWENEATNQKENKINSEGKREKVGNVTVQIIIREAFLSQLQTLFSCSAFTSPLVQQMSWYFAPTLMGFWHHFYSSYQ